MRQLILIFLISFAAIPQAYGQSSDFPLGAYYTYDARDTDMSSLSQQLESIGYNYWMGYHTNSGKLDTWLDLADQRNSKVILREEYGYNDYYKLSGLANYTFESENEKSVCPGQYQESANNCTVDYPEVYDASNGVYAIKADPANHSAGRMMEDVQQPLHFQNFDEFPVYATLKIRIQGSPDPQTPVVDLKYNWGKGGSYLDTKTLTAEDFSGSNYITKQVVLTSSGETDPQNKEHGFVQFAVDWHGQVTTYVDWIKVWDGKSVDLLNGQYDANINNYATDYAGHQALARFWIEDEPNLVQYAPLHYVDSILTQQAVPGLTSMNKSQTVSNIERYIDLAQPNELVIDKYVIRPNIGSPDLPNGGNGIPPYNASTYNADIQPQYEKIIERLSNARQAVADESIDFWWVPQAHGLLDGTGTAYGKLRPPTGAEISALTYLGLAYGAKGILHFLYQTLSYLSLSKTP